MLKVAITFCIFINSIFCFDIPIIDLNDDNRDTAILRALQQTGVFLLKDNTVVDDGSFTESFRAAKSLFNTIHDQSEEYQYCFFLRIVSNH